MMEVSLFVCFTMKREDFKSEKRRWEERAEHMQVKNFDKRRGKRIVGMKEKKLKKIWIMAFKKFN